MSALVPFHANGKRLQLDSPSRNGHVAYCNAQRDLVQPHALWVLLEDTKPRAENAAGISIESVSAETIMCDGKYLSLMKLIESVEAIYAWVASGIIMIQSKMMSSKMSKGKHVTASSWNGVAALSSQQH